MNQNEAGENKKVNEDDEDSSSNTDPENDDMTNMATPNAGVDKNA